MDFDKDIAIDPNDLVNEWLRQPELCKQYGQQYANAIHAKEQIKAKLAFTKAQLDLKIRSNPEKFDLPVDAKGVPKTTDAVVSACIEVNEEVVELKEEKTKNAQQVASLSVINSAVEQKSKALEYISRLYMSGYFEAHRVSGKEDLPKIAASALENAETNTGRKILKMRNPES